MIDFVMSCWDEEAGIIFPLNSFRIISLLAAVLTIITGAFGAHPNHDAHLLSTLSAIQILITQNALDRIDKARVVKCDYIQHSFPPDLL